MNLSLHALSAGYGEARVIRDLSLTLGPGEAVAILGRNGAGKTTLIDSIIGLTRRFEGRITLGPRDLTPLPAFDRAAAGIGWVPQQRRIFRSLSVTQNLTATARPGPWSLARVHALFPALKARGANRGDQLSGGEQQMLAIGRALMLNPAVLLMDEPTEGLAPIVTDTLLAAIQAIRAEGTALMIVEHDARAILPLTDRALILERGCVIHAAPSAALLADPAPLERHLGLAR